MFQKLRILLEVIGLAVIVWQAMTVQHMTVEVIDKQAEAEALRETMNHVTDAETVALLSACVESVGNAIILEQGDLTKKAAENVILACQNDVYTGQNTWIRFMGGGDERQR